MNLVIRQIVSEIRLFHGQFVICKTFYLFIVYPVLYTNLLYIYIYSVVVVIYTALCKYYVNQVYQYIHISGALWVILF